MWFDSQAALANIEGDNRLFCEPKSRATYATTATQTTVILPHVAQVARVARPLAPITESASSRDDDTETFEERAAICQIEGGLPRAEAEALALLHLPGLAEEAGIDDATMDRVIDVAARRFDQLQKKVRA
jgi:hypothetical protein